MSGGHWVTCRKTLLWVTRSATTRHCHTKHPLILSLTFPSLSVTHSTDGQNDSLLSFPPSFLTIPLVFPLPLLFPSLPPVLLVSLPHSQPRLFNYSCPSPLNHSALSSLSFLFSFLVSSYHSSFFPSLLTHSLVCCTLLFFTHSTTHLLVSLFVLSLSASPLHSSSIHQLGHSFGLIPPFLPSFLYSPSLPSLFHSVARVLAFSQSLSLPRSFTYSLALVPSFRPVLLPPPFSILPASLHHS